jgi:hypothetical protein
MCEGHYLSDYHDSHCGNCGGDENCRVASQFISCHFILDLKYLIHFFDNPMKWALLNLHSSNSDIARLSKAIIKKLITIEFR